MIHEVRGKEDEETVVLYFDSWPKEERCIDLPLKQVANKSFSSLAKELNQIVTDQQVNILIVTIQLSTH